MHDLDNALSVSLNIQTLVRLQLTLLVDDLVGGEVPEDLVRRRVLPDPVLVLDDLPVPEPDLLLALGDLLHLREFKSSIGDIS